MRGHWSWFLLIAAVILALISQQQKPEASKPTQLLPSFTQTDPAPTTLPSLELPCIVQDSELIIEKIASYEGDFWEDGTNAYAVDIMALVVYNPSTSGIRRAEIQVQQGSRQLRFVITYLPPGSRVLVLERFRNAYSGESLTQCRCTLLEKTFWDSAAITAEPVGEGALLLKNNSTSPCPKITLHYKRYDPQSEMYLGGITHRLTVTLLDAGGQLQVEPQHYTAGSCRIVLVEAEE